MTFSPADLDAMLAVTGIDVTFKLDGVEVKTVKGKYRRNYELISPYEGEHGFIGPVVLVKTSDMDGITQGHTLLTNGAEHQQVHKPQERTDGFTLITLAVKR